MNDEICPWETPTIYRKMTQLKAENARIKAELEELTKAGDLLAFHYISLGKKFFPDDPLPPSIMNWQAAKESKGQS